MTWKTVGVVIVVATATTMASACSDETRAIDLGERGGPSGGFGAAEGGVDAGDEASVLRPLCATSECPAGTTTCENSRARCDIDLMHDRNNCGGCGAACPPDSHFDPWQRETLEGPFLEVAYHCISGKCEMRCQGGFGDCDGIPDNGCETSLLTQNNCGACGVKCADGEPCTDGVCGCPPPEINCGGWCVNPYTDFENCGKCEQACSDPDPPPDDHHYYMQCYNGTCGRQCSGDWADCDQDLPTNGCEQRLNQDNNCGACGNVCPSGTQCQKIDDTWQCGCPPGLRKCPFGSGFTCRDVLTDPNNCGGCGVYCQSGEGVVSGLSSSVQICRGGVCDMLCKNGLGDCNGFSGDGCEIDLQTDPRHCGACGHECDLAIGQPCVKGQCVVTECGGEEAR